MNEFLQHLFFIVLVGADFLWSTVKSVWAALGHESFMVLVVGAVLYSALKEILVRVNKILDAVLDVRRALYDRDGLPRSVEADRLLRDLHERAFGRPRD